MSTVTVFIAGIFYLAILYVLVRPGSKGPTIVENVLSTLSDLVRGVSGFTFNSSTGKWEAPQ
jgi:hypothetical protein